MMRQDADDSKESIPELFCVVHSVYAYGAVHDIVNWSVEAAKIPSHDLKPTDICRSNGKCPDGASIVP